jgi:Mrp family chromosome partitioning ATPase
VNFRSRAATAFRTLQHQLEFEPGARRCLLFAAPSAGSGVTTSVAEFGLTLARSGHDVLVIDLDTREPQLAGRLGTEPPTALASVLVAGDDWYTALASVPEARGLKLAVMGAHGSLGFPDEVAGELPELLREARERFDYVLIDALPLAESGEALRLTPSVDAVVLVLRPGRTPLPDLHTALDLLERAQRRPHGLLLVGGRAAASPADREPAARTGKAASSTPVDQSVKA